MLYMKLRAFYTFPKIAFFFFSWCFRFFFLIRETRSWMSIRKLYYVTPFPPFPRLHRGRRGVEATQV